MRLDKKLVGLLVLECGQFWWFIDFPLRREESPLRVLRCARKVSLEPVKAIMT